ncbi:hypothetical protein LCGC14_2438190, partial [marine sediment metagenome]
GVKVLARLNVAVVNVGVLVSSLDVADTAPSLTATPLSSASVSVGQVAVLTNTSSAVRHRATGTDTEDIATYGWKDYRGRDD